MLLEIEEIREDHRATLRSVQGETERPSTATPPNEFLCPITYELYDEPVVCADGFSYEKRAIVRWLAKHSTSPLVSKKR